MIGSFAAAENRSDSVTAAFFGLARRVVAAHARARTLRVLSGLDDHALKDIGLTRGQIDAVERDPRYTPRFPGF